MSWLAFSTWQVWVVAALAAGTVTWLFFLRLRHPRRAVPSLMLWQRALEQERPRSVVERLRRLISLLIILAVAWLLALAPGRPASGTAGHRPWRLDPGHLALVVESLPRRASIRAPAPPAVISTAPIPG